MVRWRGIRPLSLKVPFVAEMYLDADEYKQVFGEVEEFKSDTG